MENQKTTAHISTLTRKKLQTVISVMLLAIVCLFSLAGCGFGGNGNENGNTNQTDVSQFFTGACPLSVSGYLDNENITLDFKNTSSKTITTYIAGIVYVNSNNNIITGNNGNTLSALRNTANLGAGDTDGSWQYSTNGFSNIYSARVIVYFVHFSDNTTWGQENITVEQITQYGKSYSISKDLSKYYTGKCEISLSYANEGSCLFMSELWLTFKNDSEKQIIAFEAVVVLYNVYGNKLVQSTGSAYSKITSAPTGFVAGKTEFGQYKAASNASYAEVYVYYVLYSDQTSWGVRTNMTGELAMEYGTMLRVERVAF